MSSAPGPNVSAAICRRLLLVTFIKTPTSHSIEILGGLGFDFVILDEEHAPFDRVTMEIGLLAARASGIAGIVRVAEGTPAKLLAILDDGAAGVLVPHVLSVAKAREIVAACRYPAGARIFPFAPRWRLRRPLAVWDHVDASDANVAVIAMIEDPEALEDIDAIVGVDGIDGFFIGRGDLTVELGAKGPADPIVRFAAEKIIKAARRIGKAVCIMAADAPEAQEWRMLRVSAFIVSSDQASCGRPSRRRTATSPYYGLRRGLSHNEDCWSRRCRRASV